jgi:hypothetical protein
MQALDQVLPLTLDWAETGHAPVDVGDDQRGNQGGGVLGQALDRGLVGKECVLDAVYPAPCA